MKTRNEQFESLRNRGQLADQFSSCLVLIRGNKRSARQQDLLSRAMQLFIENRFAGVIQGATGELPDKLQELLSQTVESIFPKRLATYLRRHHAVCLGEVFIQDNHVWRNPSSPPSGHECRQIIGEMGLPIDLDLDAVNWVPPYMNDQKVLQAWNKRSHVLPTRRLSEGLHDCHARTEGGCATIGQLLRKNPRYGWDHSRYLVVGQALTNLGLRPGMFVPKSWQAPERNPQECLEWNHIVWEGVLISNDLKRELDHHSLPTIEAVAGLSHLAFSRIFPRGFCEGEHEFLKKMMAERGLQFKEPSPEEIRDSGANIRLDDLELSVRTALCLHNDGLQTLGEVMARTERELLRIPNFGRKSLNEIKEVLASKGLTLAG